MTGERSLAINAVDNLSANHSVWCQLSAEQTPKSHIAGRLRFYLCPLKNGALIVGRLSCLCYGGDFEPFPDDAQKRAGLAAVKPLLGEACRTPCFPFYPVFQCEWFLYCGTRLGHVRRPNYNITLPTQFIALCFMRRDLHSSNSGGFWCMMHPIPATIVTCTWTLPGV